MTTADALISPRRGTMRRTVMSAIAVAVGAGYAYMYGVAAIPPFIALFLLGATATVAYRLFETVRSRFDNALTASLSAVTLMISLISSIVLVCWLLWFVIVQTNLIDRLINAKDGAETFIFAIQVALYGIIALLAALQVATLWTIVREDAFGRRSEAS